MSTAVATIGEDSAAMNASPSAKLALSAAGDRLQGVAVLTLWVFEKRRQSLWKTSA